jgi:hypothetical protein
MMFMAASHQGCLGKKKETFLLCFKKDRVFVRGVGRREEWFIRKRGGW